MATRMAKPAPSTTGQAAGAAYWAAQVERQLMAWLEVVDRYIGVAEARAVHGEVTAGLSGVPVEASSPRSLAADGRRVAREGQGAYGSAGAPFGRASATLTAWRGHLSRARAARCWWRDLLEPILIARGGGALADAMNLRFLYDTQRRLFRRRLQRGRATLRLVLLRPPRQRGPLSEPGGGRPRRRARGALVRFGSALREGSRGTACSSPGAARCSST